MTGVAINNWQGIQAEVLDRINKRLWKPGDFIPKEVDLAQEFKCSRATVNRALQALADDGFLDRRRKAGTKVSVHPVRKSTISIPIISQEITQRGLTYSYARLSQALKIPPSDISARLESKEGEEALHVEAIHLANESPYVFEDRWINIAAIPEVKDIDFSAQSPNQWLVENAPYTKGDLTFSAINASQKQSELLSCGLGNALFVIERRTWMKEMVITAATLVYASSYKMRNDI